MGDHHSLTDAFQTFFVLISIFNPTALRARPTFVHGVVPLFGTTSCAFLLAHDLFHASDFPVDVALKRAGLAERLWRALREILALCLAHLSHQVKKLPCIHSR